MDALIFNILSGKSLPYDEVDTALREKIQTSPNLMIDPEGNVVLSPYGLRLLTLYLINEEMRLDAYRNAITLDQVETATQVLKINEGYIDQRITNAIVNVLGKIGITPETMMQLIDSNITKNQVESDSIPDTNTDQNNIEQQTEETNDIWKEVMGT